LYRADNFAQANNQWNIGAELGDDPMGSAFARALTSGIKGVAMVLDEEVQPLTSDSTKYGTQGIAGIQLLCFFNFNIFKRDFCAEEFGAYSNFSCPTVSAWIWFSSPMLVWWVMMLGAHWFVLKCVGPGNQPCSYETKCNKSYAYGLPVRMLWERSCSCTNQLLQKKTQVCACNFSPSLWVCVSQERGLMGCKSRERPAARPFLVSCVANRNVASLIVLGGFGL